MSETKNTNRVLTRGAYTYVYVHVFAFKKGGRHTRQLIRRYFRDFSLFFSSQKKDEMVTRKRGDLNRNLQLVVARTSGL